MTKCSVSTSVFQGPKSKKIEFNFDDGDISSDGGLLFIKEFDRRLGLTRRAGTLLNSFDGRQSGKVKHSVLDMLRQRVFALVAGNEDLNDHHELRNDPLIQTCRKVVHRFQKTGAIQHIEPIAKLFFPLLCRPGAFAVLKCF